MPPWCEQTIRRCAIETFPLGRTATLGELAENPHPLLARLRAAEPVSWLPALDGWLVSRYDIAVRVLRDPTGCTVDDPRFSTSRLVGPSMLALDGAAHTRHRNPFIRLFHPARVHERYIEFIEAQADRLIAVMEPTGAAELRSQFAGPLAAAVVTDALGLREVAAGTALSWYAAIVPAVSEATAGRPVSAAGVAAFDQLRAAVLRAIDDPAQPSLLADVAGEPDGLTRDEVAANAAVIMFGGIDTTEGMILNAIRHLLSEPTSFARVCADAGLLSSAVEESVRLEPAAALVDRYATADIELGDAHIRRGDRVSVSIAGANRDPAVFPDPDRFDMDRDNVRSNLAFAQGPHVCPGAELAGLETRVAIQHLFDRLPELELDPQQPTTPRGLVFRKPPVLHVRWNRRG